MAEKMKDLIYDFSDIIISLIIITMIFGVVSWKISDSMAYSSFTEQSSKATLDQKDNQTAEADKTTDISVSGDAGTDGKDASAANTTANSTAGTTSTGGKPAAGNTTGTTTAGTTQTTTAPPTTAAPVTEFKVVIPSGSAGISIAKILKEAGIISDTKMFITRVDQLKMGPKLKAGSFTIKAGSTLDDVIYTLAGKR